MGETALQSVAESRPGPRLAFDETRFRTRLYASDVASELFLPPEQAEWRDKKRASRWRLPRRERRAAKTRITGCRLLVADPKRENLTPEREVQTDYRRLVASVGRLRKDATCPQLALARETLRCGKQPPRLRYGLTRDERYRDETLAAKQSHRAICGSIRRNGFRIVAPEERFVPASGFAGLEQWADKLQLAKRRRFWPWLLLLPLLLLLALGLRSCSPVEAFFGVPIETRSLLVVVDRSSSMQPHFAVLRSEAKKVLHAMREAGASHANVIAYAGDATSCLGKIAALDDATVARLGAFLDALTPGGGTRLEAAVEIAAREVKAHGKPTTLVVLTDAQDGSIAQMLARAPEVLSSFGEVRIVTNGLTPRLFGAGGDPAPQNAQEHTFAEFASRFGGRFGAADGKAHAAEERKTEGGK